MCLGAPPGERVGARVEAAIRVGIAQVNALACEGWHRVEPASRSLLLSYSLPLSLLSSPSPLCVPVSIPVFSVFLPRSLPPPSPPSLYGAPVSDT